jgi:biotin transport system substrate-specific component
LSTLFGPTGGYLVGFVIAAFLIGKTGALRTRPSVARMASSFVAGTSVIYILGVLQLSRWMNGDLQRAILFGVAPFLVGDALKIMVAVTVARRLCRNLPQTDIGYRHTSDVSTAPASRS